MDGSRFTVQDARGVAFGRESLFTLHLTIKAIIATEIAVAMETWVL